MNLTNSEFLWNQNPFRYQELAPVTGRQCEAFELPVPIYKCEEPGFLSLPDQQRVSFFLYNPAFNFHCQFRGLWAGRSRFRNGCAQLHPGPGVPFNWMNTLVYQVQTHKLP